LADGNLVIHNGVISISYESFRNNQLTGVIIPDSVKTVDEKAFADNPLTSVTIPGQRSRL